MLGVRIRVTRDTPGLDRAERTLVESLNNALDALGRHLQRALRGRTRRSRGDEQKNIKYEIRGEGLNKTLYVFGDLIQLWVDEYGLRPGVFPPWDKGSRLYAWVDRLGLVDRPHEERFNAGRARRARRVSHVASRQPRRATRVSRRAAVSGGRVGGTRHRAAARQERTASQQRRAKATRRLAFLVARAIFERGIKAGKPIARTFEANRAKIVKDVTNAFVRAVNKINRGQ